MNNYWIEIKRFLQDNKNNIMKFSLLFPILFAGGMFLLRSDNTEESSFQTEEGVQISPEDLINGSQPAFFQLFIQEEDGRAFTNNSIISQYFNLSSVTEGVLYETGIDLREIEETLLDEMTLLDEKAESIKLIKVDRNDQSNLITAAFNLGSQRQNVVLANYYYDMIIDGKVEFLNDKTINVFSEPQIAKLIDSSEIDNKSVDANNTDDNHIIQITIVTVRNLLIGFILGVVMILGVFLVKNIYGKKLHYAFSYDINENNEFLLYDEELNNKDEVKQFVAVPLGAHKIVVAEQKLSSFSEKLLSDNRLTSFSERNDYKSLLIELQSLSNVDLNIKFSEIIIVIQAGTTTRNWYKTQVRYAKIYKMPVKVIQINNKQELT